MKYKSCCLLFTAFLVSSCGPTISEILPIGRDTYLMTSSSSTMGAKGGELKATLIKKGTAYCAGQDKLLLLVGFSAVDSVVSGRSPRDMGYNALSPRDNDYGSSAASEITFRCLNENDPEYIRPIVEY